MKTKHITAKQYFNRPWGSVVAAILLFTACSSDTPNSSASLTVSVPHRAVSALATGDQPSNALPQDITRVAISITDSNGAQLAGGDAATGGTIALKVPPGQSLNVSGTAYAGDTARFEGKTTVPPLRPGERSNVSLTLNEIGVLQLTEPVQVDVTDTGVVADNSSNGWRFTTDNNYVLFTSSATNLVEGLATGTDNTISHVYLKNLNTNAISLVDTANDGTPGNGYAYGAEISSDGRYIVFDSDSDNLVSGDDNQNRDVFLKDMTTGQTTRLSVSPDSSGGYEPSISDDGRYITFISTNTLIAGSNGVYLFDTTSGELSFVANEFSAEISGDGKSVATWSDVEGGGPLTLYDIASKQPTEIASWTDGGYDISQDGRYVAFSSTDSYSSLDTNSGDDIYLYDKTDQTIKLIDTDNNGDILVSNPVPGRIFNYSPRISADGRYAIFQYGPLIYIKDTTTNKTITVQQQGYYPFISPDGQRIGFTSSYDQHLYVAPNPFLVPPKPQTELQGQSGNVRVYLEWSNGENLDLSIKDPCANTIDYTNKSAVCGAYTGAMDIDFPTTTGTANQVENIAWANGAATGIYAVTVTNTGSNNIGTTKYKLHVYYGDIAETYTGQLEVTTTDGNGAVTYRFFYSSAYDSALSTKLLQTDITASGIPGNNSGTGISFLDNNTILFKSSATNLVDSDVNNLEDLFIRNLYTGEIKNIHTDSNGNQANNMLGTAVASHNTLSYNQYVVVFSSDADNLVTGDTNQVSDVFLKNINSGTVTQLSLSPSGSGGRNPSVSDDASDIAFASDAPLTAGTGGVFFKARFGTLTFVDAGDLPKLSGDGNYLVYWVESATTVYEIRLYDRVNNTITPIINAELGGPPTQYSINQDGRYVAFTWNYSLSDIDTNGIPDIYLYDRTDRSTKLISTDSQGNLLAPGVDTIGAADPQISADGHFVIFSYGLLVYIKDLTTNNIATLQQQGSTPFISRDGHYIGFTSLTDHHVYVTPNPLITP